MIPTVLRVAASREKRVGVFGTDYPTPDGTAIRDFIHVEDVTRAQLLALEAAEARTHKVYNLGNGSGYSVREVVEAASRITGRWVEVAEAPRCAEDPAVVVASSEKIKAELGWPPEKPDLETMISDAWKAYTVIVGYRFGHSPVTKTAVRDTQRSTPPRSHCRSFS